jgi:hypothetical protein
VTSRTPMSAISTATQMLMRWVAFRFMIKNIMIEELHT